MKGLLQQNKQGAAAVEFAIVLPVFVLILLGSIETCTMIFLQQSLEMAAYEGARVAIVPTTLLQATFSLPPMEHLFACPFPFLAAATPLLRAVFTVRER